MHLPLPPKSSMLPCLPPIDEAPGITQGEREMADTLNDENWQACIDHHTDALKYFRVLEIGGWLPVPTI